MTDELLYERLALSIDRLHSPVPHVHGVVIGSINQLYPLLLASIFASRTVAQGLHLAHVLNAFVMVSAAIPAYLLARRVTRNTWASSLAALLTVIVPWLARREPFAVLAGVTVVLLTLEVASYDLRFGGGLVRDRYLFYIAPVFAIAFAAALASRETPRWSLAPPVGALVIGLALAPLPVFEKLNVDTPVSIIDGYLRREVGGLGGARLFLVVAAV